ncbi:MAG: PAS domain S-box protein [Anaerolineae bacterium]|nr:PAS domain S-box protein [Anaerolineae bacterium]
MSRLLFSVLASAAALWSRLTEPSMFLTDQTERRDARLITGMMLLTFVLLIFRRVLTFVLAIPYTNTLDIFILNLILVSFGYLLSRTRYYRIGTLSIVALFAVEFFAQTVLSAAINPTSLGESAVWIIAVLLIGGVAISWRHMLLLVTAYLIGIVLLPFTVPGVLLRDTRFAIEFILSVSILISITAALRSRDIRRIEDQSALLITSENRYRTLLDAGFEAIIIHDNGVILDANDPALRLTGYGMDEIMQMKTIELVAPEAQAVIAQWYKEHNLEKLVYESVLLHKDGHRIDVEVRSRAIEYQNKLVRVIAMRDITESKQAREQLKNLFDNLDRVFFSFSIIDNRMLQISPSCEKIFAYPQQTFYDDPAIWLKIAHPDDKVAFLEDFMQIADGRRELRPFRIVRKDGEVRWIEMLIMPAHDSGGNVIRYDGLVTDMTERREVENQQRELRVERERSVVLRQFINDASHDLRTPLATMYTSLYLLRRVSPEHEKVSRYLDTLEEQTGHLNRVVNDLFTMSRLDAPESYVEKFRVDINQLMENVVNNVSEAASQKQIQIRYQKAPHSLWVMGDKDYLIMALGHVITNAVQYTPSGGCITVRNLDQPDKQVCVEVEDTGIGIHPTEIGHIYDRFYRSDKARQTDSGGVGLGLSLARKIVEIHNGTILAESEPGKGSTFRITLPLMLQ